MKLLELRGFKKKVRWIAQPFDDEVRDQVVETENEEVKASEETGLFKTSQENTTENLI